MGQNKGATFERDVCRALSLWWSNNEQDDIFWRNKTRRTGKAYNAQLQEGDIIAVRATGIALTDIFCIECKSGYSSKKSVTKKTKAKRAEVKEQVRNIPWDLLEVLDGIVCNIPHLTIVKFWEQTIKAAKLTEKIPLLIFKRDYHVPVVVIDKQFLKAFNVHRQLQTIIQLSVKNLFDDQYLYLYRLDFFLNVFSPMMVKKYAGVKIA